MNWRPSAPSRVKSGSVSSRLNKPHRYVLAGLEPWWLVLEKQAAGFLKFRVLPRFATVILTKLSCF
jgi:hypothetical protein